MTSPSITEVTAEQRVILDCLRTVVIGSTSSPAEGISALITLLWDINNTYKAEGQGFEIFITYVTDALRQLELAHGPTSDEPN